MKKLLTGLFLAISALPAAFAVGVAVMQHTYDGGLPTALDAAAKTIAAILGLALFVFCSGLTSKVDAPKSAADAEQVLDKK
ncbi:hypothetical protein ACSESQ_17695 [Pseudomonas aeruginosa]|nr:hypothetical protein [Pseudomonas aeruginosa]